MLTTKYNDGKRSEIVIQSNQNDFILPSLSIGNNYKCYYRKTNSLAS